MVSPSIIFAAAYLVGTAIGIPSGLLLPWLFAGAPAWALLIAVLVIRPLKPTPTQCMRARLSGIPLDVWHEEHDARVRCLALGLFWGAMAGAAAASMPTLLDALVWPGHDDGGFGPLVAGLVAVAWAVGVALEDETESPPLRPNLAGFGLYLAVVTLSALPALWEVL